MRTSRRARIAWWAFGVVVLGFVYVPLAVIAINSFNQDKTFGWPPTGFTSAVVVAGPRRPRAARGVPHLGQGRHRRHRTGPRARRPAVARPGPLRLLRQDLREPARHPPDRPARHRHGPGAAVGDHRLPDARARHPRRAVHDHRRARDVLHRGRLQQRHGAAAADGHLAGGRVGRPGCRCVDDVPAHHPAAARAVAGGGCAARVRPVLRRDRGDHLHRRTGHADPADLDLQQPVPPQPGAGGQRRRGGAGARLDPAGLAGAAAQRGDAPASHATRPSHPGSDAVSPPRARRSAPRRARTAAPRRWR